jgi:hypothetical protein
LVLKPGKSEVIVSIGRSETRTKRLEKEAWLGKQKRTD